jgi:ribosomal protein S18 acetylase RimI-like enzyme
MPAEWLDGAWLAPMHIPVIFYSAIATVPGAPARLIGRTIPSDQWVAVSDPWSDMALHNEGFELDGDRPWMVRRRGTQLDEPAVGSELRVDRVTDPADLEDFERTEALGFGTERSGPLSWHGPSLLADERIRLLRGLVGDVTVSVAQAFHDSGVVGIYGVTTIPAARRRGYATALTRHAMSAFGDRTAVLQPSHAAEPLYRRLGFDRFGTFRSWIRPPRAGSVSWAPRL